MKFIDTKALDWVTIGAHRTGTDDVKTDYIRFKRLYKGAIGTPGNFEFTVAQAVGTPPVPEHKHNFDQIRYSLTGAYQYKPGSVMQPGDLAYFPEGAYYGPEACVGDPIILTLQFGGASGGGFMSMDELVRGSDELKRNGRFENGVYYRNDGATADGYEAVWQHVKSAPISYPAPRYHAPILVHTYDFKWHTIAQGVFWQNLGVFTEARTECAKLRLLPGARHRYSEARRTTLAVVLSGRLAIDGAEHGELVALSIEPNEAVEFEGRAQSDVLFLVLPDLLDCVQAPAASMAVA